MPVLAVYFDLTLGRVRASPEGGDNEGKLHSVCCLWAVWTFHPMHYLKDSAFLEWPAGRAVSRCFYLSSGGSGL